MPDERRDRSKYAGLRSAGMLLAIPALLIVAPLIGAWIGGWLDRRLKTSPWLLIVGLVLGFAAAGRETYLIYRRTLSEEKERD